jgi:hypothetical protein
MKTQTEEQTVNIDGKTYVFADLPDDLKNMIVLYNRWNTQLADVRSDAIKLELALKQISIDIGEAARKLTPPAEIRTNSLEKPIPPQSRYLKEGEGPREENS